jgi:hypothetical protein
MSYRLQSTPSLQLLHSVIEASTGTARNGSEIGARVLGNTGCEEVVQLEHTL